MGWVDGDGLLRWVVGVGYQGCWGQLLGLIVGAGC